MRLWSTPLTLRTAQISVKEVSQLWQPEQEASQCQVIFHPSYKKTFKEPAFLWDLFLSPCEMGQLKEKMRKKMRFFCWLIFVTCLLLLTIPLIKSSSYEATLWCLKAEIPLSACCAEDLKGLQNTGVWIVLVLWGGVLFFLLLLFWWHAISWSSVPQRTWR